MKAWRLLDWVSGSMEFPSSEGKAIGWVVWEKGKEFSFGHPAVECLGGCTHLGFKTHLEGFCLLIWAGYKNLEVRGSISGILKIQEWMRSPKWRKVGHGQLPNSRLWGEEQESIPGRSQWSDQICQMLVTAQNLKLNTNKTTKPVKFKLY